LTIWSKVKMQDWPEGYAKRVLEEVDSTNAEAARIAPDLAGPTWILGLTQTAGHGRRGRVWTHPKGNFAGSLVMRPAAQASEMAKRSFVAALALHDALSTVTGQGARFALKWPNDILLNGGKVAGILLESAGGPGGIISHIAIGMGVNLAAAPDVGEVEAWATRPVSLLSETGVNVTPEEFLDVLAPAYARWEAQIATYGFDPIRTAWLARAAKIGEVITARTMREEWSGPFETVDNEGNLVLKTSKGVVAIPAADVFF
jgi:BirA family biotin operon repressor/biotin-[acetyl-CoA-carboxylase] ligase